MSWPYRFGFSLTPDQVDQRRRLLDSYAQIAQYSVIFPLLCLHLPLVSRFLVSQAQRIFKASKTAPTEDAERSPVSMVEGFVSPIIENSRKIMWLLDDSIWPGWGTWKEAVFGVLWGSWLLALVLRDTGDGKSQCTTPFT